MPHYWKLQKFETQREWEEKNNSSNVKGLEKSRFWNENKYQIQPAVITNYSSPDIMCAKSKGRELWI